MWNDFVHPYGRDAGPMRGVGEPVGPERSPAALVECQRHEALLNLAFHDTTDFWLVCPYDISGLDAAVITEAQRAHPIVSDGARERASLLYDPTIAGEPCAIPLPEPGGEVTEVGFTSHALVSLRGIVGRYAIAAGLTRAQAAELVIAVNEVATNSLVHGGGCGTLRMWNDGDSAVCEVRDRGRIEDPLVGRFRPSLGGLGGRGLWLVNQLCDLVQVRTFPDGTTVRMHTTRCR
jgi:anti-sigma regulatory factor (Ser/Thr protein kinase)